MKLACSSLVLALAVGLASSTLHGGSQRSRFLVHPQTGGQVSSSGLSERSSGIKAQGQDSNPSPPSSASSAPSSAVTSARQLGQPKSMVNYRHLGSRARSLNGLASPTGSPKKRLHSGARSLASKRRQSAARALRLQRARSMQSNARSSSRSLSSEFKPSSSPDVGASYVIAADQKFRPRRSTEQQTIVAQVKPTCDCSSYRQQPPSLDLEPVTQAIRDRLDEVGKAGDGAIQYIDGRVKEGAQLLGSMNPDVSGALTGLARSSGVAKIVDLMPQVAATTQLQRQPSTDIKVSQQADIQTQVGGKPQTQQQQEQAQIELKSSEPSSSPVVTATSTESVKVSQQQQQPTKTSPGLSASTSTGEQPEPRNGAQADNVIVTKPSTDIKVSQQADIHSQVDDKPQTQQQQEQAQIELKSSETSTLPVVTATSTDSAKVGQQQQAGIRQQVDVQISRPDLEVELDSSTKLSEQLKSQPQKQPEGQRQQELEVEERSKVTLDSRQRDGAPTIDSLFSSPATQVLSLASPTQVTIGQQQQQQQQDPSSSSSSLSMASSAGEHQQPESSPSSSSLSLGSQTEEQKEQPQQPKQSEVQQQQQEQKVQQNQVIVQIPQLGVDSSSSFGLKQQEARSADPLQKLKEAVVEPIEALKQKDLKALVEVEKFEKPLVVEVKTEKTKVEEIVIAVPVNDYKKEELKETKEPKEPKEPKGSSKLPTSLGEVSAGSLPLYRSPLIEGLPLKCQASMRELVSVIDELMLMVEGVSQRVLLDEKISYMTRDVLSRRLAKIKIASEEAKMAANLANLRVLNETARSAGLELMRLANSQVAHQLDPNLRPFALKLRKVYGLYRKSCKGVNV